MNDAPIVIAYSVANQNVDLSSGRVVKKQIPLPQWRCMCCNFCLDLLLIMNPDLKEVPASAIVGQSGQREDISQAVFKLIGLPRCSTGIGRGITQRKSGLLNAYVTPGTQ